PFALFAGELPQSCSSRRCGERRRPRADGGVGPARRGRLPRPPAERHLPLWATPAARAGAGTNSSSSSSSSRNWTGRNGRHRRIGGRRRGRRGEGEGGGGGQSTLSTTAREMPPLQASMPQGRHLVWKSGAPNRAASRARGLENVAE
ncbi:unnamed protein product, partial [Prorocentrum cordatum]